MAKSLFFFLIFFTASLLHAQKTGYLFYGKVSDSIKPLENVHVVNLQTNQGTFSDQEGKYKIYASLGDSLRVSSVQFFTKIRIISKDDLKSKIIDISLDVKNYELDEIIVKNTNLTGSLYSDIKQTPEEKEISAVTLGLPNAGRKKMSHVDRKIYAMTTSQSGIPFDFIIGLINGNYKKLKEEKKIVEENNDVERILRKIKPFLKSNFNIKEESQHRFILYCVTDSTFKKNIINDELKLISFLKVKSEEFNKLLKKNLKNKCVGLINLLSYFRGNDQFFPLKSFSGFLFFMIVGFIL